MTDYAVLLYAQRQGLIDKFSHAVELAVPDDEARAELIQMYTKVVDDAATGLMQQRELFDENGVYKRLLLLADDDKKAEVNVETQKCTEEMFECRKKYFSLVTGVDIGNEDIDRLFNTIEEVFERLADNLKPAVNALCEFVKEFGGEING